VSESAKNCNLKERALFPVGRSESILRSSPSKDWSCEKIDSEQPRPNAFSSPQPKTRAERAFHQGGAGTLRTLVAGKSQLSIYPIFATRRSDESVTEVKQWTMGHLRKQHPTLAAPAKIDFIPNRKI
jgi:hypothetical protein